MHARYGFRNIKPLRAPCQARNDHGERSATYQKNRGHELERHRATIKQVTSFLCDITE
jgi:hypothetical protein